MNQGLRKSVVLPGVLAAGVFVGSMTAEPVSAATAETSVDQVRDVQDSLPELTPEGLKWVKRLLAAARATVKGKAPTKPPYIEAAAAALVVRQVEVTRKLKRAGSSIDELLADAQVREHITFVRDAVVSVPWQSSFDYRKELLEALNRQDSHFPPSSAAFRATTPEFAPLRDVTLSELSSLANLPAVRSSERHWDGALIRDDDPSASREVAAYFVNGVTNTISDGIAESARIKSALGGTIAVDHIHNGTASVIKFPFGLLADSAEALLHRLLGATANEPAIRRVTEQILADTRAGKPVLLICHSQGAQKCNYGLRHALQQATHDVERSRILELTRVVTLGGYADRHDWPEQTKLDFFVNPGDPVPGLTGVPTPLSVLDFLKFRTVSSHAMPRYLNDCAVQLNPPADCACKPGDECVDVMKRLQQICIELNLPCASFIPTCQSNSDCNPPLAADGFNGDDDCFDATCDVADSRALPNGCVLFAAPEPVGSGCSDGDAFSCTGSCNAAGLCEASANNRSCNDAAREQDGDSDCYWDVCNPSNPSHDERGCVVNGTYELTDSKCDDGFECSTEKCVYTGGPAPYLTACRITSYDSVVCNDGASQAHDSDSDCKWSACNPNNPNRDARGCVFNAISEDPGSPCSDGYSCTTEVCVYTGGPAPYSTACQTVAHHEFCNGTDPTNDPDADCLASLCNPADPNAGSSGCAPGWEFIGSACDDGNLCTVGDSCYLYNYVPAATRCGGTRICPF